MLTFLRTQKGYFLPSILALLYFIAGAHLLHPQYHGKEEDQHRCAHHHDFSGIHHHPQQNEGDESKSHSCDICDFLAANFATQFDSKNLFIPIFTQQTVNFEYLQSFVFTVQTVVQIRGPPTSQLT